MDRWQRRHRGIQNIPAGPKDRSRGLDDPRTSGDDGPRAERLGFGVPFNVIAAIGVIWSGEVFALDQRA